MSTEMVHVYRGEQVESIHRGDLVVVDFRGNILYEVGSGGKETFWRSAAKPFQTIPFVEAGGMEKYGLTQEELALMTASHRGEPAHIEAVKSILKKGGFEEGMLSCGLSEPINKQAAEEALKNNNPKSNLYNACSGKHSGMLLLCKLKGYDQKNYTQLQHPLQQEILKVITEITLFPQEKMKTAVDGCGVPVFFMPLYNMALAYAYLAEPSLVKDENRRKALKTIADAMSAAPFFVAGTQHLDTVLMEATKGRIIAKHGTEAVYCVSIRDKGIGIALKIEDGQDRGVGPVIIETMKRLGYLQEDELERLKDHKTVQITNRHNEVVGSIKAVI